MQINNFKTSRLLFFASLLTATFWVVGSLVNVYKVKLVGVIFEMLWLPMLAGLFVLPVLSFIMFFKEKYNFRSLSFYSLLILLSTALFLFLINR